MKTGISRSLRARSESQCIALHCSFLAEFFTSLARIVKDWRGVSRSQL